MAPKATLRTINAFLMSIYATRALPTVFTVAIYLASPSGVRVVDSHPMRPYPHKIFLTIAPER